jgi:transketolase
VDKTIDMCRNASKQMRIDVIRMTRHSGNIGAHIGGSLSMIEIMAVLYNGVIKFKKDDTTWEGRDRFILSKGHGVMAQYAAMKSIGLLSDDDLMTFKNNETRLYAHPSMNLQIGIEFSSGSLGQGLSLGVGTALALRKKNNYSSHVYVLVGDGECNEGQIWEAAMAASHFKLNNLTVIVDKNKLQYDGETADVMNMDNFAAKWSAFGFETLTVDGHSVEQLLVAFRTGTNKPKAIIAETVKGKGVSFMENNPAWHNNRLTEDQYKQAMAEQGVTV